MFRELEDFDVKMMDDKNIMVENVRLRMIDREDSKDKVLQISWSFEDEELGTYLHTLAKENYNF